MPTPTFTLRLPLALQRQMVDMAKSYGAPNVRAFTKDLLEAVVSGDPMRAGAFTARLLARQQGQLLIAETENLPTPRQLGGMVEKATEQALRAQRRALQAKRRAVRGKGAGRAK